MAGESHPDEGNGTDERESPQSRVDAFVAALNSASENEYVQDVTFDPSDKDSPYRPRRYSSPVYSGSAGSHGSFGAFGVTVIGCKSSTEVSAVLAGDGDYQAVADFARIAIYAAKPDADQAAVESAIGEFSNGDSHRLDFMGIDNGFDGHANAREFFLRFK